MPLHVGGRLSASIKGKESMRTRSKLLLAGLTAALMLSAAVSTASAGHLSLTTRNIRVTWNPLRLVSSAGTVECPVTFEGSFHSATINKTVGALIGHISRATVYKAACRGGTAEVLQEHLPWHTRYRGFKGSLPTITGVELGLIGAAFHATIGGIECETETTATEPGVGIAQMDATGRVTGLRADESKTIPLEGGFFCAIGGSGRFSGLGTVTGLGNTTPVTIKLI